MPPSKLTKGQLEKLREFWDAGLTSVGERGMFCDAVEATGLVEKTVKVYCHLVKFRLLFPPTLPALPSTAPPLM